MKLEQQLSQLCKQLAVARRDGDVDDIEMLEDQIAELEYEIEEEANERYAPEDY